MEQTTPKRTVRVIPVTKAPAAVDMTRKVILRVAAYCRVSTDTEEQINSYEAQKAYYTQLIEENPEWEMAGVFADEGISGTGTKKRVEFNRMIAACKRGRIDLILTKSLSRFSRNTLDCIDVVRTLKERGIGVIFEKENINTLTQTSEFMMTLFSGFAQAESESISKNVSWGIRKSMESGNTHIRLLGYRKGPDGQTEIDPEGAKTVRRIYRRYLEGASLGDIKDELEADGVPSSAGTATWHHQTIRNILSNEKYMGDALLQKTYVTDCIKKTVRRNKGERPMYYVENHHEAIIPRELFQRVQEEMTRRGSKRKVMQKSAKTEQGKYSGKYALSELLVCGECGSPYRRCTWARNGKKRIVWRCVSRLEFGKKFCHYSPTMEETRLQNGILEGLNQYAANREEIIESAMELALLAGGGDGTDGASLLDIRQKLEDLAVEENFLLEKVLEDMENPDLTAQLQKLTEEKKRLAEREEALQKEEQRKACRRAKQKELLEWMRTQPARFTAYDDTVIRKAAEKITVVNESVILIKIRDTEDEIRVTLK